MDQSQFNRGRWELERERCQISSFLPPHADREPARVADVLPELLRKLGLEDRLWMQILLRDWPAIAGEAVARHARPGRMDQKTLIVFVDSGVWVNELKRYGKAALLKNVQQAVGAARV
ncbi:MAG: DUF721 domain-containing protein, partial [bacterium]